MIHGEAGVKPGVWIVSELYYPEDTSTGYFLTGIAEGLARRFGTGVICCQPTYSARGLRAPRREVRNGVSIIRCRTTRFDRRLVPLRLINLLTITASVLVEALWNVRRGDTVIVVTNPPTLPLVTLLATRLRGARPILLVHDVYPDVLAATGLAAKGSLVYRLLDRFARLLYRRFDRIVVLGRDMRELLARKIDRPPETLTVIPNFGDPLGIVPRTGANPLRDRLGLARKFVIQYGGNVGRTHGIDALLHVAKALRADDDLHFLIIGSGARRGAIEMALAKGELPNVTLMDTVPREELPVSLTACDLAIVTLLPGMKGVSVPSRMYNIFAAGRPIVAMADPESEIAKVLVEEGAGWVIPPNDVEALLGVIREARENRAAVEAMGRRGRAAVERCYTPEHVIAAWTELVDQLRVR